MGTGRTLSTEQGLRGRLAVLVGGVRVGSVGRERAGWWARDAAGTLIEPAEGGWFLEEWLATAAVLRMAGHDDAAHEALA